MLDKETAHTQSFEEVKDAIRAPYVLNKADKLADNQAEQISSDIRRSNKVSLDEIAQKYHLTTAETRPVSASEPVLELGNTPEVKDQIFHLQQGQLSLPLRTDRGYVVLSLKQVALTHQGTLEEVRDKIVADLKQQKALQVAQSKASELEKRVKAGEKFDAAAKALGLESKTSELFARSGNIPGVGSGKQFAAVFSMTPGQVGAPVNMGANWVVYVVAEKIEPNPADLDKQKKSITDTLLQTKRSVAFDAFRTTLEARLKKEGLLKLNQDKMRGFGDLGSPSGPPIS